MTTTGVQSVQRVAELLKALSAGMRPMSVSGIARQVGLPVSTTYRLVAALEAAGLVQRLPDGHIGLGVGTLDLANAARRHTEAGILWAVRPSIQWLAQQTQETVIVMMPAGSQAVCVDQIHSLYPVRLSYEPGRAMPLYAGASNKVLLAFLDQRRRDKVIADSDGKTLITGGSIDRESLERQIQQVRDSGHCVSEGEINPGTTGLAVPLLHRNRVIASLTVAGPNDRIQGQIATHLGILREAANRLQGAWD
jgi:IclR family KDG regulon transcriptional repressor